MRHAARLCLPLALRGRWGGIVRNTGRGFLAHATCNEQPDDDGNADNDSGNDKFFEAFPAALCDIQLKTGRNLKRILRAHTI
jgi:hypothetical protein